MIYTKNIKKGDNSCKIMQKDFKPNDKVSAL